jgi:hypothetical protein
MPNRKQKHGYLMIQVTLKCSQRKNYTCYPKKVIDKNVDHMNLRKISLYGSVNERFIQ